jgi:NAD(P)-dependent dehydrogenase (short-subunit alcohol dehydrogenase family)
MDDKTVWFVTGASRGLGVDIVKAALAAGHSVVATGRNRDAVAKAVGPSKDLHILKLDVTSDEEAKAAVADAITRFGHIDVLVNNAGNFYAGFFEEISQADFRAQVETVFFGTVNVTRAVLPVLRAQRSGLIITISSTGGITGQAFVSAYSAAKFAVEGWMESLAPEIAPFGIHTMLVEPGFFRTELLTDESTKWPEPSIADYAETTREPVAAWKKMNGQQGGDPAKLAHALIQLASEAAPPQRWPAGADAVETFARKANELLAQAHAYQSLSESLSYDVDR